MADDPLNTETSLTVELSETGVKANARSRFVAAIDRLGGNLAELANAPMERRIARQRAVTAGEVKIIEAAAQYGVDEMRLDSDFAHRASKNYFKNIFAQQENKDGVMREALQDLRHAPPSDAEAAEGVEVLDEEFITRFEGYAAEATTDQLRGRWGRVLASEIRKPGTFSGKVLRVVDEIDQSTALLFEQYCQLRIEVGIPKCFSGKLPFEALSSLVMAGLVLDPGLTGHVALFGKATQPGGSEVWFMNNGYLGVSIPIDAPLPDQGDTKSPVISLEGKAAAPVYLFTDAGRAIASIFSRAQAFDRFALAIRDALPAAGIKFHVLSDPTRGQFTEVPFPA